jgi:DNA-binding IclR family transcriptional regulator
MLGETGVNGNGFESRVPSVDRALDLLEFLVASERGLTLSEISRALGMPKSSAHYLLHGLAWRGYVERAPGGRVYCLGPQAARLTTIRLTNSLLMALCEPYVRELARMLNLCVLLGILDSTEALVIAKARPSDKVKFDSGQHFGLHCTALGKSLIAFLPKPELTKLLQNTVLTKHNLNTISSLPGLEAHLRTVRACGFAIDNEEYELGVRCVAAPIFNFLGKPVASICVFGPNERLPNISLKHLGSRVAAATAQVSRYLSEQVGSFAT